MIQKLTVPSVPFPMPLAGHSMKIQLGSKFLLFQGNIAGCFPVDHVKVKLQDEINLHALYADCLIFVIWRARRV